MIEGHFTLTFQGVDKDLSLSPELGRKSETSSNKEKKQSKKLDFGSLEAISKPGKKP